MPRRASWLHLIVKRQLHAFLSMSRYPFRTNSVIVCLLKKCRLNHERKSNFNEVWRFALLHFLVPKPEHSLQTRKNWAAQKIIQVASGSSSLACSEHTKRSKLHREIFARAKQRKLELTWNCIFSGKYFIPHIWIIIVSGKFNIFFCRGVELKFKCESKDHHFSL